MEMELNDIQTIHEGRCTVKHEASDGLPKFDQESIYRKQKTVIRSLAKGVMRLY